MPAALPVHAHPGIDEQIATLDEAVTAAPTDATLRIRRGELHRIHQDWGLAEADFRAAIELDPELAVAQLCLGRLKLEAGEPEEARSYLDRYLLRRPEDPEARTVRARALERLGEHLAAAEDFTRAIAAAPRGPRPELYLERARALRAAGPERLEQALRGLDEGREQLGDPVTLQLYAIELEIERKNYDAALRRIDEIATQSVRKEPWLVRRGTVLEAAKRPQEARLAYRQALDAIETLPASRRGNRAVSELEAEARAGLQRIDATTKTQ